jgi:hypothetical protein
LCERGFWALLFILAVKSIFGWPYIFDKIAANADLEMEKWAWVIGYCTGSSVTFSDQAKANPQIRRQDDPARLSGRWRA